MGKALSSKDTAANIDIIIECKPCIIIVRCVYLANSNCMSIGY